jgi:hypothetical protein
MGGLSPKTCWASHKYEIKFWYTVAPCQIFYMNYTMIHGSTNIKLQPLPLGQTTLSDPQICVDQTTKIHTAEDNILLFTAKRTLNFISMVKWTIILLCKRYSVCCILQAEQDNDYQKQSAAGLRLLVWRRLWKHVYLEHYSRDGRPTPWNVLHWLNTPASTCTCASTCNHDCPFTHTDTFLPLVLKHQIPSLAPQQHS